MRITPGVLLMATMALSACSSRVELPNNDPRALVDAIRASNKVESTLLENNVAVDAAVDGDRPGYLRFAGILNLGNGRVEGRLPAGAARNAGSSMLPAGDL